MTIRANKDPQHSCECVGTQQVIKCVIYMVFVDPCLHVLPCNLTSITYKQSVLNKQTLKQQTYE